MAKTARCPSCGAPVEFRSASSVLAVCDFCRSTLVRHDEALEDLGKMAALIEDASPVRRGSEGRWQGLHFAVVGRLQLRYQAGNWNEWHLLFDDGNSGWLSEAGGEYVLSRQEWTAETLPRFAELKPGQRVLLKGRPYAVTNLMTAECASGEGELPFKVGSGYPLPMADLRDAQGGFATLDYSDDIDKPLLFTGAVVQFKGLAWNNLREGVPLPEPTIKARALNCTACGAPITVTLDNLATVGCGNCGAVLGAHDSRLVLLDEAAKKRRFKPLPEPGSRGRLRGEQVEVLGFMRRRMTVEGSTYRWNEYLLRAADGNLQWLTEYDGHWNLGRVLPRAVTATAASARLDGEEYKHFQDYTAYVDYVVGEFPWRVRLDDGARVSDFVAPPRLLSRERNDDEETWTLSEYLPPEEIQAAFAMKSPLPSPRGVFANQPNPFADRHRRICRWFWTFLVVALVVHFGFLMGGSGGRLLTHDMDFAAADDEARLSPAFRIDKDQSRLILHNDTNLPDNRWIALQMTLVNKDSGESWQASREIGIYSGVDEGERWVEGSRDDDVTFAGLPAGNYLLAVESDMDDDTPAVRSHLTIERAGPRWSSLFLLLLVLLPIPFYSRLRKAAFEVSRWAESDHPIVVAGDDDSSDSSDD